VATASPVPPARPPAYTQDRPATPAEADVARADQTSQATEATQSSRAAQAGQTSPALAPGTESALWTPLRAGIEPAGRAELQELLGWRYEACLRTVTSALALHPTLRQAAAAERDLPALIALNAYLTGSTDEVDAALRGELSGDDSHRDLLRALAAGAVAGLARFPISRSPIFVAGTTTSEVLSGLVRGELLVEPAFVLASSRPTAGASAEESTGESASESADESAGESADESAGKKIQYALWPQAARRVAQLMPNAGGSAPLVVAAGSSWRVLGFADDEDGTAGWEPGASVSPHLPTVFLAQAGGRAAADDDKLLERLGRALKQAPGTAAGPPRAALGHDRNGNRFRLEPLGDETEIRSA
jgi:hypothetical protein